MTTKLRIDFSNFADAKVVLSQLIKMSVEKSPRSTKTLRSWPVTGGFRAD